MSFKDQRRRKRLKKKGQRGFRGYPVGTVAYYDPDDQRASKVVASIIAADGAEPEIQKSFSETTDVRVDAAIKNELLLFFEAHNPNQSSWQTASLVALTRRALTIRRVIRVVSVPSGTT